MVKFQEEKEAENKGVLDIAHCVSTAIIPLHKNAVNILGILFFPHFEQCLAFSKPMIRHCVGGIFTIFFEADKTLVLSNFLSFFKCLHSFSWLGLVVKQVGDR